MSSWREVLNIDVDGWVAVVRVGPVLWLALATASLAQVLRRGGASKWAAQEVTFAFGGVTTRLTPDDEVARIAHHAWTELATRKAGIPIDPDDVIAEIYDSWYQLFGALRELAKEVPVASLHRSADATTLLDTLVAVMNQGLRPHLTEHQAKFRHWWATDKQTRPRLGPQERQLKYPDYANLMAGMHEVTEGLISLTDTLRKLAHERQRESLPVRLVRLVHPRFKT